MTAPDFYPNDGFHNVRTMVIEYEDNSDQVIIRALDEGLKSGGLTNC